MTSGGDKNLLQRSLLLQNLPVGYSCHYLEQKFETSGCRIIHKQPGRTCAIFSLESMSQKTNLITIFERTEVNDGVVRTYRLSFDSPTTLDLSQYESSSPEVFPGPTCAENLSRTRSYVPEYDVIIKEESIHLRGEEKQLKNVRDPKVNFLFETCPNPELQKQKYKFSDEEYSKRLSLLKEKKFKKAKNTSKIK
jgi:hypothetical protein